MTVKRQLSMVMDLNKCIGCHTCTSACKLQWTNRSGREYMYWNNVETMPGAGYPRDYAEMGGGFDEEGALKLGKARLDLTTLERHAGQLRAWSEVLEGCDVLVYGWRRARPAGSFWSRSVR